MHNAGVICAVALFNQLICPTDQALLCERERDWARTCR